MKIENHYLAVYQDASFKVFLTKEQALAAKPMFVANATPSDYLPDRKMYHFKFVDEHSKPYKISCDGWTILSVLKYYWRGPHTEIKIASPDGEIRKKNTNDKVTLESIVELLPFINQFRGYKNWSYYDLMQENIRLARENQELKNELAEKDRD